MILFPNCKINLGLRILRKRDDSFHDIETVFYPVPLHDALEVIEVPTSSKEIQFSSSGIDVDAKDENNICIKAFRLLQKDFDLPQVKMHLHKSIPPGAGLGGGSSDGTFTLMLLNKKFNLGLSEYQLINYALQLGSDCPFFVINKPCYATGRGEKLEIINIDLSPYRIVIVNPGIHISTAWAFSQIIPQEQKKSLKEIMTLPLSQWKDQLENVFEEIVFAEYPQIKNIKGELYRSGALYASMSGSGSTVFGIFAHADTLPSFPTNYFVKII